MPPRRTLGRRVLDRVLGPAASPSAAQPMPPIQTTPRTVVSTQRADGANVGGLVSRVSRRLDTIRNTMTGMGEDKVQAGRPDMFRLPLSYTELQAEWRFGGISRRFVEVMPNDATRKGWRLLEGDGEPIDMIDEDKRLQVRSRTKDADTWGRLYGGAWLLLVVEEPLFPGVPMAAQLEQPLDLSRIDRLLNLVVLDRVEATAVAFEPDPREISFREPSMYHVTPRSVFSGESQERIAVGGQRVHASRMIYFHGAKLPPQLRFANRGIDDSVLQSVWDQVRNMDTVGHSLAALSVEMRIAALKMENAEDLQASDQEAYFRTRMRIFAESKSVLNAILLAAGESYEHHTGTVAGMEEIAATTRQALQAVTGMPEQLWIGNAPGGLSTDGESHRNLWANVIASYQVTKLQPPLERLYEVIFAAKKGPWGGVAPDGWHIEFNPLDELTQAGEADLRLKTAQTDEVYVSIGVLPADHITKGRFGKRGWQQDLPPVEEDAFAEAGGIDMGSVFAALSGGGGERQLLLTGGDEPPPNEPSSERLEDRRRLAAQMTKNQTKACEHGSRNRCRLCGIERRRGLATGEDGAVLVGEDGAQQWTVTWAALDDFGSGGSETPAATAPEAIGIRRAAGIARSGGGALRRRADGTQYTVGPPAPEQYRADEEGEASIWVGIPLPESMLATWEAARLEAATIAGVVLDDLDTRGRPPHVTVLHMGRVPQAEAAATTEKLAAELNAALGPVDDGQATHRVIELEGTGLGAFEPTPNSQGDTPLFVGISSSALRGLHDALQAGMFDSEEIQDRRWFSGHATLGFYAGELTPEQWDDLWMASGGTGKWDADTVELRVGGTVVSTWRLADR